LGGGDDFAGAGFESDFAGLLSEEEEVTAGAFVFAAAAAGSPGAGFLLGGGLVAFTAVIRDVKAGALEQKSGAGTDAFFHRALAPTLLRTELLGAGRDRIGRD
jgi:hypothetical protein